MLHPFVKNLHILGSPSIIRDCRKKSRLLKHYSKNPTHENKIKLTHFRNQLKSALRREEKNYYNIKFLSRSNNLKATWKLISKLLGNNSSNPTCTPTLATDN